MPFAFISDDALIAIDNVAYDKATLTATLSLNGGLPLPGDEYRLYVRGTTSIKDVLGATLDGNGDQVPGDDFVRTFTVVNAPPKVVRVNTIDDSGDGVLEQNEVAIDVNITRALVTFDEPVQDPPGNTELHDVTNPANC